MVRTTLDVTGLKQNGLEQLDATQWMLSGLDNSSVEF